jgi:hypothetical protein
VTAFQAGAHSVAVLDRTGDGAVRAAAAFPAVLIMAARMPRTREKLRLSRNAFTKPSWIGHLQDERMTAWPPGGTISPQRVLYVSEIGMFVAKLLRRGRCNTVLQNFCCLELIAPARD